MRTSTVRTSTVRTSTVRTSIRCTTTRCHLHLAHSLVGLKVLASCVTNWYAEQCESRVSILHLKPSPPHC